MIYEILLEGKDNKKSTEEIIKELNIDKRDFYYLIRKERREGKIIISTKNNGGGYWIWDKKDLTELEEYYKMQSSGAIDILTTLKPIYKLIKEHKQVNEN